MAATRSNNHVSVLLQYDVRVIVKIENHDWREFRRRTTRSWSVTRTHKMYERLNDCVVRGIHVERK